MRNFRTEIVPATERTVIAEIKCDLCGKVAPSPRNGDNIWANGSYQIAEVVIKMRQGSAFPDCGDGSQVNYDICPECFGLKLMPWLGSQHAMPTEKEWDY